MRIENTFEGGSDETTITTGNSGGSSGTAFDQVEGAPKFDTARALHGSYSLRCDIVDNLQNVQWRSTAIGADMASAWTRHYVYLTANPGAGVRHVVYATSGLARMADISILSTGILRLSDSAFTSIDSAKTIPLNVWVRLESYCLHSATVGVIRGEMYVEDDPVAYDVVETPANRNTGTASRVLGFGQLTTNVQTTTFWMDSPAGSDTGPLGPFTSRGRRFTYGSRFSRPKPFRRPTRKAVA